MLTRPLHTGLGRLTRLSLLGLALLAGLPAAAQIRIGQTAGFSGAVAAGVKETTDGAKLYLDAVNRAGGVNGQTVELVSLDDKFQPALAAENARQLIDQGVTALFLTRGTPHTQAILPLLAQAKVPLVGPSTGAMALHQPVHPWVFNVRASYQREAERAIRHLSLLGVERVALVQVDDSFGEDAATGAMRGFEAVGRKPVAHEKFNRDKPDLAPVIAKVVKTDAQAVFFIGSGAMVADGMKQLRAAGSKAQGVTLSNNASAGFIKSLGEHARGMVVAQVFPYERSMASLMIKEARDLLKAQGGQGELTPAMVEGFAAAKVLVEGLRRAGKSPTREALRAALETFRAVDIGGLEVSFSPTDHSGLDYADLAIVDEGGRFRR
ncbi:ABC transporter substrate-binding protein [Ideonella livida]|uniref:ABC transporter substrate-binding protein n=1 Tax=Ideonella livida TaxID=2707176 RepID=A0A7C9TLT0_9BURK|nr:ABC transporter substrate-binding protein [Ideonella livida]NDY91166.1 ABC transporter substrate-binding protein [Ideonella livida]